jgi:hypothetical protein
MPKKSHVGYTRLSKKHIDNYLKGKSFTVKPSDHDDETNTVVKLHYKAKKNLSKLDRNLKSKKGTRIDPEDVDDIEVHTGNGFFDSLKKVVSSPIMKDVVKAATPAISNIVGNQVAAMTGSQTAGDVTKSLINSGSNAYSGSGFNLGNAMHSIGMGINHEKGKKGGSMNPLGGSISANQYTGIGPNVPSFSNPDDKMAYVRSCRKMKQNGIVMA